MGSLSIWQWLFVIFLIVVLGIPIARILTRIGYSKWWTIVYFIPFVNIVGIWILAYSRWPAVDRTRT
jgi:ABC-type Fe3+ transport system permease subunit